MPALSDMSKLYLIVSTISIKCHFLNKLAVYINFYWAASSFGAQNPPNLPKLTEAE
jgi:hypothetical protein